MSAVLCVKSGRMQALTSYAAIIRGLYVAITTLCGYLGSHRHLLLAISNHATTLAAVHSYRSICGTVQPTSQPPARGGMRDGVL
jgi:hypothetical protein